MEQRTGCCPGGVDEIRRISRCAPDLTQYIGGFRCTLETAAGRLGGMVGWDKVFAESPVKANPPAANLQQYFPV